MPNTTTELAICRDQLKRAREAGAAALTDLEHAQKRIESLCAQLRASQISAGKLALEVNRLERLLSDFAREQMQEREHRRQIAGAVRRMFAGVVPTGHWVDTANGRVFINVRELKI